MSPNNRAESVGLSNKCVGSILSFQVDQINISIAILVEQAQHFTTCKIGPMNLSESKGAHQTENSDHVNMKPSVALGQRMKKKENLITKSRSKVVDN